ncbi:MAG: PilZ domain-containing protein [Alsobacter sp.]
MLPKFRFLMNRPNAGNRAFERHDCMLMAHLFMPEKEFQIDGLLVEISRGGALFREASTYILDRRNMSVMVRFLEREYPAVIVNVSPKGYGLRWSELLPAEAVQNVLDSPTDVPTGLMVMPDKPMSPGQAAAAQQAAIPAGPPAAAPAAAQA